MNTLASDLTGLVEDFCLYDYERPEKVLRYVSDSEPKIIWLWNHVQAIEEPTYRHLELKQYLFEKLCGKYFIPKEGPLVVDERCHLTRVPAEVINRIFTFLRIDGFKALTLCSRRFFYIGYEWLARDSKILSRYLTCRLRQQSCLPKLFLARSYNTPIALDLVSEGSHSFKALRKFPHVYSLKLHENPISRQTFAWMKRARQIRELILHSMPREQIRKISFPSALTSCDFSSTDISDATVIRLQKSAPQLQELNLNACRLVTRLAFGLPFMSLVELKLSHQTIDDTDLTFILNACPTLKRLCVTSCDHVTGDALVMAANVEFLEELNISCCERFTDVQFVAVLANATSLTILNVGHCDKITTAGFLRVTYPKTIKYLQAHCCNVDDRGLRKILQLPKLEVLDLSNNFKLTQHAFRGINHLPSFKEACFEGTAVHDEYESLKGRQSHSASES